MLAWFPIDFCAQRRVRIPEFIKHFDAHTRITWAKMRDFFNASDPGLSSWLIKRQRKLSYLHTPNMENSRTRESRTALVITCR